MYISEVDFEKTATVAVLQREFAITNARSKKPVLGTTSAISCIILAIYNEKSKILLLAHMDAISNTSSLNPIVKRYFPAEESKAYLAWGKNRSEETYLAIKAFLQKASIVTFEVNQEIVYQPEGASLAIDSRTGDVYTSISLADLGLNLEEAGTRMRKTTEDAKAFITELPKKVQEYVSSRRYLLSDEDLLNGALYPIRHMPLQLIYKDIPRFEFGKFWVCAGKKGISTNSNNSNRGAMKEPRVNCLIQ